MLQSKRKYFDSEQSQATTKKEKLEWMRLYSEKDRVDKYKSIATTQTKIYYNVLDKFAKMLDQRKEFSVMS